MDSELRIGESKLKDIQTEVSLLGLAETIYHLQPGAVKKKTRKPIG